MSNTFDDLVEARRNKLEAVRASGGPAFPNDFKPNITIREVWQKADHLDQNQLEVVNKHRTTPFQIAGRIKLHRVMGKTSFAHISDHGGALQLYLKRKNTPEEEGVEALEYDAFKHFDLGDIVGVTGWLYRTQKGELSIKVTRIRLLTKSLLPLPDKFKGLSDQEIRYRQRYLDLMVNKETIDIFESRSRIVRVIRNCMEQNNFMEVETPMMHPIPGGATARPFTTHHNALDMELFLRIAPELYLKRLIVGGFNRVFELNRNFRNEGLSPRHNPEFTMMEFYAAYWDYTDLMAFIEDLVKAAVASASRGATQIIRGEATLSFDKFTRLPMATAVLQTNPWLTTDDLKDGAKLQAKAHAHGLEIPATAGAALQALFEATVEKNLIQPTFITEFPTETSPLARRNDKDASVADRFELYIMGQEIANGFSELNDADDQAERFRNQVAQRTAGNDEAMHFDADYITALQYGMPPTAGAGIGIDRLVMLLLGQDNIRDVILFPQMRAR